MATYVEWNEALFESLFEPEKGGAPVYLAVDDEVLSEIAEDLDLRLDVPDASEDFAGAVRSMCVRDSTLDITGLSLRSPDETPSQLAFLALCVLAASRMAASFDDSTNIASTNFYARFVTLLNLPAEWLPPSLENRRIELLWRELKLRLLLQDRGDLQLTDGPKKRRFVWYPISQCLLSKHDRNKLKRFFKSESFPVYCDPLAHLAKFEEKLFSWISRSTMSARVKSFATLMSGRKEELTQRVRKELASWNGEDQIEGLNSRGAVSSGYLRVEVTALSEVFLSAVLKKRASFDATLALRPNLLNAGHLQSDAWAEFYDPIPLPDSYQLGTSISLVAQGAHRTHRFELPGRSVYFFRRDPRFFGALLTTERLILGEESAVICSAPMVPSVMNAIKETTGLSNSEVVDRRLNLNGWALFKNIVPCRLMTVLDESLAGFSIMTVKRIALIGGVCLHGLGKRRVYLAGYLPTVELLGSWQPDDVIRLDGVALDAADQTFALPTLPDGTHKITYGENQSLSFEVMQATPKNEYVKKMLFEQLGTSFVKCERDDKTGDKIVSVSGALIEGFLSTDSQEPAQEIRRLSPTTSHVTLSAHRDAKERFKKFVHAKLMERLFQGQP